MEISPNLFARARKLKRPAVDELFAQVYPAVVRIAKGLSGREDVADGVVRFVMVRATRMIPTWRDETAAERWFLHHTVLTARRAAAHEPVPKNDLLAAAPVDSTGPAAPPDPAYVAFVRAVRQLPVQQREAFLLHAGEHFNNRYLGVAMDCSTQAAQAHLDAANDALRTVAGPDQFDPMVARLAAVYAHLGPTREQVFPSVRKWVNKGLRPQRLRRAIRLTVVLAVLGALAWTTWKWNLLRITGILPMQTTQPAATTQK
jgi:DNA-directed RNA polymerase specialized sigma24 family protein